MSYLDYYGLTQEPFSNAPVGKFYFDSKQHSEALLRLKYAAESMKGLALLIGDIGTGKTTLARKMLDQLPEDEYESALLVIIHTGITANWLLRKIAMQLGVKAPTNDKLQLLSQLYNRLVELHESNRKAVVLVDEAQMLQSKEIMEEFRGLLNLELPEKKLLTFIFFGLPEMEDYLQIDEPLAQRVAMKYTLSKLDEASTEDYINFRLKTAGANETLFTKDALKSISTSSRGVPRLINTLCDVSLFEGYLVKAKSIGSNITEAAAFDLGLLKTPGMKSVPLQKIKHKTEELDEIDNILDSLDHSK
ncbi:ExeA family protein [Thermodesulfobacteriota bacterium]